MKAQKKPQATRGRSTPPSESARAPRHAPFPWRTVCLRGLLVVAVLVAYWPSLSAEFIWDDETNITNNQTLRSLDGLRRMWFVPSSIQQYYPLMYTTYWVEYHLWGLAPLGYHLDNILLHTAAALLVWRLLARLQVPGAWLAAAIFALHPVEVESVAWVTERKNVLSLALALLSILAYFRFSPPEEAVDDVRPTSVQWYWYAGAFVLFALALFAKTVVVTLPAVLLVIYWWKRGRLGWRDVSYALPFFMLSVAMGLVTRWIEVHQVGAAGTDWSMNAVERVLLAGRALWFYAAKLIWPHPLALFYPRFDIDAQVWWQYLFPLAALALPVALWLARARIGRGPLAAVLIFSGVMVPALGFFDVYFMQYAQVSDHFQYHASVALIALAAATAATAAAHLEPRWREFSRVAAALVLCVLGVLTFRQTFIYHDLETLYHDTIAKNPQAWIAYLNLSAYLDSVEREEEALAVAREGLEVKPTEPRVHASLGNLLGQLSERNHDEQQRATAIAHYQEAVRLNPAYTDVYCSLGFMALRDDHAQAVEYFQKALEQRTNDARALYGLGSVEALDGRWDKAQTLFEQALAYDPNLGEARNDLILALVNQGKRRDAIRELMLVVRETPQRPAAHFELANQWAAEGDFRRAVQHYLEVLRLQPTHVGAVQNLGAALLELGEIDRAIPHLQEALRLDPNNTQARENLEYAQARQRDRGAPNQR